MTDEQLEKRIRAGLADAAADVDPTGTLAGLRARIDRTQRKDTLMAWQNDAREFGLHDKQGGWRLGLLVARNVEKGQPGRPPENVTTVTINGKVSATAFAEESGTSAPRVLRYLAAWERAADAGHVPHAAELHPGSDPALDVEGPENQLRWFDFYRAAEGRISTDTPRGMAIWREADAAGVSVHKTDEAARNPRAVQAAIRAVPEVAEAATKALVSTPESADRTYRKARAALISQARDDQGRPPPEKQDRVKRIEDVCEDVIRKLAEVLDPDTDPLGQRLAFLEQNLDALGEPHRKRLGRAVIELGARVSAWEDRVRGLTGHTVAD